MDLLNIPSCGGTVSPFNSGIPLCDILLSKPIGIMGFDPGVGFGPSDRVSKAAMYTKLRTMIRAPRGSRAYPFFALTDFQDKSKEPTRSAVGNLSNADVVTADAVPSWSFEHQVGVLMQQKLVQAENAGLTWGLIDKNYTLIGTVSNNILTGYTLSEFYTELIKLGTSSSVSKYGFSMTVKNLFEYKENFAFYQLDKTLLGLTGIRDVVLDASVTGSVLSVGLTAIGGTNIATLFSTELAQTGAWTIKKTATGASVTVSPVYNATTGKMDITLSGTPWTGATNPDAFTVDLVTPAALYALTSPIDGYESTGPVTFLKP